MKALSKKQQPIWISPMLATLVEQSFSKKGWLFEKKFDGIRCLVFVKNGKIKLYSRNRKCINHTYPEIVKEFEKRQRINFIMDGEIVIGNGKIQSFSKLQSRMYQSKKMKLNFFAFDLLFYQGFDLRKFPLIKRKKILKTKFSFLGAIHYTSHILTNGETYFKKVSKQGWEGVIAKKIDSTYQSKRGRDWLKFKSINQQEFVIGGYTEPQGHRSAFGALLIGFYQKGKLKYAGKVGTGYTENVLTLLSKKLKNLERKTSPFNDPVKEKNVHFVLPKLVCECGYTEWTKEKKLRHPRFLGLRLDKDAKEVTSNG